MKGIAPAHKLLLAGAAGAAILAVTAACGDGSTGGIPGASVTTLPTASASVVAFNDADVAFAQNMIPHHQQAVEMAELAATKATDPEIRQLAAQIKAAQDPEIQTLTGWLSAWRQPVEPASGHGGHSMPGMMSDAEMAALMATDGAGFDRMFAEMMIAHHNGAIQMARDVQTQGSNADAKALAATIERTQATEVTKLQAIVDRL